MATTYRLYYSLFDENRAGNPFPVVCRLSQKLGIYTNKEEQTLNCSLLDITLNKGD